MALDTLRALVGALSKVVVVSALPALASRLARAEIRAEVVMDPPRPGMNAALAYGADRLREAGVATILACVGDLPALRVGSVRRVIEASLELPPGLLPDLTGVGTTMLVASAGLLDPHFQGRSAARHRASGAVPLTAELLGGPLADARHDVDTEVDLATVIGLGVGPHTAALIDQHGAGSVTINRSQRLGRSTVTVIRLPSPRPAAGSCSPRHALTDGLRHARSGQRLHAVTSPERVLSAWL